MQNPARKRFSGLIKGFAPAKIAGAIGLACAVAGGSTGPLSAQSAASPAPGFSHAASSTGASAWSPAPKSRARLVAAGPIRSGAYTAGVEIALDGNALTYWRNPGDSGVPPEFDFSGSTNLARVKVAYPAPERHDEEGSEVFGWRRNVVFPLTVEPKDAGKPVTLSLNLRYAACEKICIPSEGRMSLTLTSAMAPGVHGARIAQWAAQVPRPAAETGASLALEPIAGAKKRSWRVRVSPPQDGGDLFAEGRDGYFFDTRVTGDGFKLVLAERPAGAPDMTVVRMTLRRPSGAVEFETKLDAGKAAP